MIKTLIHVHTDYSLDSNISLWALEELLIAHGFDCVAVTDHDTIDGALRMRDRSRSRVIVGEEVSTRDGHLIGLFLEHAIPPGLPVLETAHRIREQNGLVFVPHPYVSSFGCGLMERVTDIVGLIDAVEVCNAQNLSPSADHRAVRFAREHNLVQFVGADSHSRASIAPCYQIMPSFEESKGFLGSLRYANLIKGRHPLSYFAATAYRIARYYAGLPQPGGFGASHTHVGPRCHRATSLPPPH